MRTWHDIARVRAEHPDYRPVQIARELGCNEGWVRATFTRRGWKIPDRKRAFDIDAVVASYRSGAKLREIAAVHPISAPHIVWIVKHHAPGEVGFRKRGRPARSV